MRDSRFYQIISIHRKKSIFSVLFLVILTVGILVSDIIFNPPTVPVRASVPATPTPIPSIKPIAFTEYKKPNLPKKDVYNIYLVGDSMTHAFGPRGGVFTEIINKKLPGTFFEVSNYAQANQSILVFLDTMQKPFQADLDLVLPPVMEGDPDLIIIESFGYNPLSQFGRVEGLRKQEEVLMEVMLRLTQKYPDAHIMFLATIAPDKKTYAENISEITEEERWVLAEERIEYITNHMKFAQKYGIPIINAYEKSLDDQSDGDLKYINPDDNIHPSSEGLALIGRTMSDKIFEENIFPE